METVLLITTVLALLGAYLNSHGYKLSFLIWIATNAVFAIHNWYAGEWQQAILFAAYWVISINGLMFFKGRTELA
jgi:nicotinamide riboside transporter PnuC